MRTNVVLDDQLVKKALRVSGMQTKRALIAKALEEYVHSHSALDIRELKGKISFRRDYDYKALR